MATIKALENNKWQLSDAGISVTYGFSVDDGINICEFSVLNENGNVNYCQKESSIVPIVKTDPCCENGRPPFRWNLLPFLKNGENTLSLRLTVTGVNALDCLFDRKKITNQPPVRHPAGLGHHLSICCYDREGRLL